LPPGFSAEHLGPNDYYYWDNFWALAGLKAAAEMVKRNGLESKSTEISICTQCKGTWLATGQFLNLINALLDEANQKPAPELVKISLQQAKEMLTNPD
jgi:Zn-finger nucleic acid-binding protein